MITHEPPTTTNHHHYIASTGTGPVDAAYVAVTKALGIENIKLLEFAVSRYAFFFKIKRGGMGKG